MLRSTTRSLVRFSDRQQRQRQRCLSSLATTTTTTTTRAIFCSNAQEASTPHFPRCTTSPATATATAEKRYFHFASNEYAASFQSLPTPDVPKIRQSAIDYLDNFDPQSWYNDPVRKRSGAERSASSPWSMYVAPFQTKYYENNYLEPKGRGPICLTQGLNESSHTPTLCFDSYITLALTYYITQQWQIASLLTGQDLRGGTSIDTVNALGRVNGRQEYATTEQVQALKEHIRTYQSPSTDYREAMRAVEQQLLYEYSGMLIGNQCLDFEKQDGVTEIEESIMANHVERRLNDLLLRDEVAGTVAINRKPIYVSCVSNFTNFLDLFRKTLRSMELGIPCVVLCRSNTAQHSYRWTKLLMDLSIKEGVDPGMITYLSCPLEDIQKITQSLQEYTGNLYSTCSRELAASIKSGYPNTVASTGGPNTLIAMDWTPSIQEAIRMSATIESSGQCTALRHAVVPPSVENADVVQMLGTSQAISSAAEAMKASGFDGIFANHEGSPPGPTTDGYQRHASVDASFRIADKLPPNHMEEHWRKVVVDVSKINAEDHLDELINWLNTNQPISMAVTGKTREQSMEVGLALWSSTGLVVNTIGSPESPAMTCQARPQEAEVFGEFPPRRDLSKYTKYPVVVPSSTPGYDTSYTESYLTKQAVRRVASDRVEAFLIDLTDIHVKGYCVTLMDYLTDATQENPKRGFGTIRTALWGLQRPPLHTKTYLKCDETSTWDDLAPSLLIFFATNAKDQAVVVVPSANASIQSLCEKHDIATVPAMMEESLQPGDNLKLMVSDDDEERSFPMVGHYLTTLLPVGHIKSTLPNDEDFVTRAKGLAKWLKLAD